MNEGESVERSRTAVAPDHPRKPESPPDLRPRVWKVSLKRATHEFSHDECMDLAAGLTYYGVLSIFPGLLALVSLLGVFGQGQSTVDALLEILEAVGQGDSADTLRGPITDMVNSGAAGLTLVVGLVGAIWSASGYIGAFGRAMNRIYGVDEGRTFIKLRPTNLALTLVFVVMAALILLGLVLTGDLARAVGDLIGLGEVAVTVWSIAKWPVILLLVIVMVALLYWATPNVKQPRFRWLSIGAAIAIVVAIIASAGFGFYVSGFSNYDKTYGSLAGVIVFLLWMWLMNLALLFGAEVDAEMERGRELQAGMPAAEDIQLPPRGTKASEKRARKREQLIEEQDAIRERNGSARAKAT
ncbi:YihY/virulence factor BrkB family protein [Intrasporangium calvum]|uniref:YihY/virulence factor BrkB family protein n=1 Tax=Intrasporangium calvum TaxID=53358 RepID=A0ABT5GKI3_9MICO|nr:YihY/virulence factor BrkB family protein [Intrasporangium calvum]MDC5698738.1 YihY/virulence factor BrkB family protein [Intrasporangium calvum]